MTNENPPMTEEPGTTEDPSTIHLDQFFPHPVERVWHALTTPDLMAKWLMANDFEPRVGHRFTLQAKPMPAVGFSGTVACEVPRRAMGSGWRRTVLRRLQEVLDGLAPVDDG